MESGNVYTEIKSNDWNQIECWKSDQMLERPRKLQNIQIAKKLKNKINTEKQTTTKEKHITMLRL